MDLLKVRKQDSFKRLDWKKARYIEQGLVDEIFY